jgi:lysozyme family protein
MTPAAMPAYPALFVQAVTRVLSNEGGFAMVANDPGGVTNFGISQRDYPKLDIRLLTRGEAIAIYFRDFWSTRRYGDLPDQIAVKVFDLSVNMGPAHAIRCLQRALRSCGTSVTEDGALGNESIAAAKRVASQVLLAALRSEAAGYYRSMVEAGTGRSGGERNFLEGWLNRAYQ